MAACCRSRYRHLNLYYVVGALTLYCLMKLVVGHLESKVGCRETPKVLFSGRDGSGSKSEGQLYRTSSSMDLKSATKELSKLLRPL
ncbi:hypothetical protein BRADI_3g39255v3 [Brachypodium distachyon]|uniref:Uncharacterized protein n=1 Tax=Brachypodium distachyon TaxID=15368 RepID=A0A0Q3JKF6_BRADI|nr:hypothetical protein BRADI_3g39255v3 [Brachypodium distachyon]